MKSLPYAEDRPTLRLWPTAGQALGLGRSATYAAAERGEIPTIRVGGRILVPTAALRRLLHLDHVPPAGSHKGQSSTICSVPGCDTAVESSGPCHLHYRRLRRTGDPSRVLKRGRKPKRAPGAPRHRRGGRRDDWPGDRLPPRYAPTFQEWRSAEQEQGDGSPEYQAWIVRRAREAGS